MRLAPLRLEDRARISDLLVATAAFSSDEVAVALELFDETYADSGAGPSLRSGRQPSRGAGPSLRSGRQPSRPESSEGPALTDYEFVGAFGDDGILLGYACFGPTPSTDGTYDLYWLAVDPAAQGRGAGRALVRWVEHQLGLRGARLLVVETSSRASYSHAREFYARGGYTEVARVRDFYAPADDRIILTTRLSARERGAATR